MMPQTIIPLKSISYLDAIEVFQCFYDLRLSCNSLMSTPSETPRMHQTLLEELLTDFRDVFPSDLPLGLPPSRAVDHQIEKDG